MLTINISVSNKLNTVGQILFHINTQSILHLWREMRGGKGRGFMGAQLIINKTSHGEKGCPFCFPILF